MKLLSVPLTLLAALFIVEGSLRAQTPSPEWVGQRVVMLRGMGEVHSGLDSTIVRSVVGINIVTGAVRVDGRRLWVVSTSGEDSGWVDTTDVLRLSVALPYFAHLIEQDSTNWDAYLRRAEVEHAINRRASATVDYTKAIQLHPVEAFLFLRRGRHYGTLHDCRNEIADFDRGIALVPSSRPQGYNLTAELYALEAGVYSGCPDSMVRNPHRAIASIQHAIALDQTRPIFFVNLAAAYAAAGDLNAAITAQERALSSLHSAPSYRDEWRRQLAAYEQELSKKGSRPPRE